MTILIGILLFSTFSVLKGEELVKGLLITMFGQFSPTIGYFLTKKRYKENFKLNLSLKFDKWLSLSIIVPVLATISATSLLSWTGVSYIPFGFKGNLLIISILTLVIGSMGEEIGWRGYFLTKMNTYFSPVKSSVIVGFLWGLWHFFKIASSGIFIFILYVFSTILMSVIMGYIFNKSKLSVMNMTVFHSFMNFATLVLLWQREVLIYHVFLMLSFMLILAVIWLFDREYFRLKDNV